MTDDLIERLERADQFFISEGLGDGKDGQAVREAAQALKAKDDEIARLKEALKPFANAADAWSEDEPDDHTFMEAYDDGDPEVTLGDFRRARTALGDSYE